MKKMNEMDGWKAFDQIMEEIKAENDLKKDYLINPRTMEMNENGNLMMGTNRWGYEFTEYATQKFAGKFGIPSTYFNKIDNHLKAYNVNYLINEMRKDENMKDEEWLIRTKEYDNHGLIRGILSKKYTKFDNDEFLEIVKEVIKDRDDMKVVLFKHDEEGIHIRLSFTNELVQVGTLKDGSPDLHELGLHIENSEVGYRSVKVRGVIHRLICSNGLIIDEEVGEGLKQRHIGISREDMYEKVAVAVASAFKQGKDYIKMLERAKEIKIDDPIKEIERHINRKAFPKSFEENVKKSFEQEKGNTVFHLIQSFTHAAHSYSGDFRVEIERKAGHILEQYVKAA